MCVRYVAGLTRKERVMSLSSRSLSVVIIGVRDFFASQIGTFFSDVFARQLKYLPKVSAFLG